MPILEIGWLGDSLEVVRGYSEAVRRAIGSELRLLQGGEKPLHARPLKTVGREEDSADVAAGHRTRTSTIQGDLRWPTSPREMFSRI